MPINERPLGEFLYSFAVISDTHINPSDKQWRLWEDMQAVPLQLSVNVSPHQFASCDMHELFMSMKHKHRLDTGSLQFELTESSMMDALTDTVNTLARLREEGVRIAMDHFGTGFSSLSVLTTLPIDTVKLDRTFTAEVAVGSKRDKIVSTVLNLAKDLDLDVIAEGIETESQLAYIRERQCDLVQGFLLSRPMPAAQLTELLLQKSMQQQKKAS